MATQDLSGDYPGVLEHGNRRGLILRALAATAAVLGVAVVLWLTGSERAAAFTLILLVVLSAIGVFSLLATLTGVLRVAGEDPTPGFARSVLDGASEGIAVTTGTGRVIYANPALRARIRPELDFRTIEQAFGDETGNSEALYRLIKAACEGRDAQENIHTGLSIRVRRLPGGTGGSQLIAWTLREGLAPTPVHSLEPPQSTTASGSPAAAGPDAGAPASAAEGTLIREADTGFMRFFQNTPMAIATVDRGGKIARANALFTRLFESTRLGQRQQPDGSSILDIVAERDRAALETHLGRRGELATPLDAALAGQGERWARFYVTPVDQDDAEAAIVYALEITEQRSLESQFLQSQKLETVGQLAGGMAHDFNNVLSAIMMATDFLLNAHRPSDPSFQDIMQIKQNANRAASLVRQLLAFSRRQTLRPQVLDLGEALSDLSILLRRLIGEKVTLDVQRRDVWPVKADLSQFEQVIVNLAINARDAMPDGGKLTVQARNITQSDISKFEGWSLPAGDYVLVEVADTGTGIPPDVIGRIFEPFFSTKEKGKGTGLGLSMVYGIIKQTGGFILPESEVGKGTVFRIFLPRHTPTAEDLASIKPTATESRPARAADDTGQGTILLVEDEEGLRGLNARGLKSRGYNVLEAGNGLEAIELIDGHDGSIDLVVSDVVMPEMDGPALLKELRKRSPDLKIIFVSGYAEEAFAKSLPDGGQFEFLAKPFTLKQLIAKVKDTMAQGAQARLQ
ncbi:MAG: response regulator [Xanthobacteraceae bacterium]|nr:response regulator [Xanthobacteraceae bacterium]MBV9631693.1 response regulator [Xanthobacteraceae bacterium]